MKSLQNSEALVNSIKEFEIDSDLKLPKFSDNANTILKKEMQKGFKKRE